MSKNTISLCMIVKNEEEFLKRCLISVKDIVDEIIIVDTGSTDSTIEIAREFNSKIYHFEWNGDFAAARNYSIKHAKSDYILILDADEYLDENSKIINRNLGSGKDYYIVNIKNHLDSQIFTHQAIRVFKNNRDFFYKGKIHEHINIEDFNGLTKENADFLIHHTGYTSNLYYKKNKHERNLKLLLEEVKNHPSGYNYFNLGNQYKAIGDFNKALSAYKEAFYLSKDRVYLSFLLNQMGKCLFSLKRFEEGIELINNSIASFPSYTDLHFTLGELYESLGYLKDAEMCYLKCLELGEVKDQQSTEGVGSYLAFFNLTRVYEQLGDLPMAMEQSFISLQKHKNHLPTLINFIKLLKKAEIPLDQTGKFLENSYPIREQVDINNIVISLFLTRSPLLLRYLDAFHLNVEKEIRTIALQYGSREEEALTEWNQIGSISYELAEDVIALSLKNQTLSLLSLIEQHFNKEDFNTIKNLIIKENTVNVSTKLEKLCINVIGKSGLLGDIETVKYLLNILTRNNTIENVPIVQKLLDVGLNAVVKMYISAFVNVNGGSIKYLEIIGDLFLRNGSINDALFIFDQILKHKTDYSVYEKIYLAYLKAGDLRSAESVKNEILNKFKLAEWPKR